MIVLEPIRTAALLVLLVCPGCGPALDDQELGIVVFEVPEISDGPTPASAPTGENPRREASEKPVTDE